MSRRLVQFLVIGLIASPLAGMTAFRGTLAAADLFGLPLADPLAALQAVIAGRVVVPAFIISAILVTACYFMLGGRFFCGWVCPVNLLTELADKLRSRLGGGGLTIPLAAKGWLLLLTIGVTAATGLPFFEMLSPIGMTGRAIAFKGWPALACLAGLLLIEVVLARRLWCRSLCPLGGFYALVGRYSPLRLRFHPSRCNGCGDCRDICPVEEVLAPSLEQGATRIDSGDCTRCGLCIDSCTEHALTVSFGYSDQGGPR
jgi:ferredoxin-type protein NapH